MLTPDLARLICHLITSASAKYEKAPKLLDQCLRALTCLQSVTVYIDSIDVSDEPCDEPWIWTCQAFREAVQPVTALHLENAEDLGVCDASAACVQTSLLLIYKSDTPIFSFFPRILPPQLALLSLNSVQPWGDRSECERAWRAIWTHPSLRRLDLTAISLHPPTAFSGLSTPLQSLHLADVGLYERTLVDVIQSCKTLENLALDRVYFDSHEGSGSDIGVPPPANLLNLFLRADIWDRHSQRATWGRWSWLAGGAQLDRLCICYHSFVPLDVGQAWMSLSLPKLRRFDFVESVGNVMGNGLSRVRHFLCTAWMV